MEGNKPKLDLPLQDSQPYVFDTDDDIPIPAAPDTDMSLNVGVGELDPGYMWDDKSDDDTLAVMAAGMDPDSHMPDPTPYQARMRELEDTREQTLLQVAMAAEEVAKDSDNIMHQEATHYLVEKDVMDALKYALDRYKKANEDYIGTVDGIDATPSTPEL